MGEFATLLGVNPRTVRRWLALGLLPYVQLPGGVRRIPYNELKSILQCRLGKSEAVARHGGVE